MLVLNTNNDSKTNKKYSTLSYDDHITLEYYKFKTIKIYRDYNIQQVDGETLQYNIFFSFLLLFMLTICYLLIFLVSSLLWSLLYFFFLVFQFYCLFNDSQQAEGGKGKADCKEKKFMQRKFNLKTFDLL